MSDEQQEEPKFEAVVKELEDIVAALEGGNLELDKALTLFERGVTLCKSGMGALDDAERKVEVLMEGRIVDKTDAFTNADDGQP